MSGPGAAAVPESVAWDTSPALYLSCGMASLRGRRPALTDSVAAAPSFTALSPPLGLNYFAVFDGAAAAAERLRAAIAEVVGGELRSEKPRFGGMSRDVEGWWRAVIRDAFWRAVGGTTVASGTGGGGGVGTAAAVALILEKYIVLANCGACKAVLSRAGEHVELTPEHKSLGHGTPLLPDVMAVERTARDDFLILASDGLWDAVTPASACALVRRRLVKTPRIAMPWEPLRLDTRGSPTVLAKELAEHAVRAGSQDNVSVVLILFRDFWAHRCYVA